LYTFNAENGANEFGISFEEILISLSFALLHAILEIIFLRIESTTYFLSFSHYSIICFNGRFGWVPFQEKLTK
jgi:hypothetical protein